MGNPSSTTRIPPTLHPAAPRSTPKSRITLNPMTAAGQWRPIEPLDPAVAETIRGDLAAVDALHRSWESFTHLLDEADCRTLRRRTLRKHAIETGILERLYQIDWGVTETLVAEGLTREVVARAGGEVSSGVLAMLEAQMEGLDMVTEYVRDDHPLTTSFIKQLHMLITRAQPDYEATDPLGRPVRNKLEHGTFKSLSNSVRLADGAHLEFAPPEQVDGEIERLVEWYEGMGDVHPVVSAAWLHHRFVQIHPFQDGNGRVARALTLLSLERRRYPPLVVDRDRRDKYLDALNQANDGDLAPLGRLFAKLAMRSIRRELEEPKEELKLGPRPQTAKEVARFHARKLKRQEQEETERRELAVQIRAQQIHSRIEDWLKTAGKDLKQVYTEEGRKVEVWTAKAAFDDPERAGWWRYQIIQSAKRAEHYADLSPGAWWTLIGMRINGIRTRFVASIHHVGSTRTGVMAITSFGDIRAAGEESSNKDAFVEASSDAFTFSHDEEVEDRADELYEWLDQSLAVVLMEMSRRTLGR